MLASRIEILTRYHNDTVKKMGKPTSFPDHCITCATNCFNSSFQRREWSRWRWSTRLHGSRWRGWENGCTVSLCCCMNCYHLYTVEIHTDPGLWVITPVSILELIIISTINQLGFTDTWWHHVANDLWLIRASYSANNIREIKMDLFNL